MSASDIVIIADALSFSHGNCKRCYRTSTDRGSNQIQPKKVYRVFKTKRRNLSKYSVSQEGEISSRRTYLFGRIVQRIFHSRTVPFVNFYRLVVDLPLQRKPNGVKRIWPSVLMSRTQRQEATQQTAPCLGIRAQRRREFGPCYTAPKAPLGTNVPITLPDLSLSRVLKIFEGTFYISFTPILILRLLLPLPSAESVSYDLILAFEGIHAFQPSCYRSTLQEMMRAGKFQGGLNNPGTRGEYKGTNKKRKFQPDHPPDRNQKALLLFYILIFLRSGFFINNESQVQQLSFSKGLIFL